jgi:hypothetical protein
LETRRLPDGELAGALAAAAALTGLLLVAEVSALLAATVALALPLPSEA